MTEKLPLGVHHSKGVRFRTVITVRRKQYHLGTFDDVSTAERVYVQSKKMVDDLMSSVPERIVHVPFTEYITVEKPTLWSRLVNKVKGFSADE